MIFNCTFTSTSFTKLVCSTKELASIILLYYTMLSTKLVECFGIFQFKPNQVNQFVETRSKRCDAHICKMRNSFANAILAIVCYSLSIDCPNMINLASGLRLPVSQTALWTALQIDCCTTGGITCIGQRVTKINWSYKSLNGIINGSAIPSTVIELNLESNQLRGGIPLTLPSNLTVLLLQRNSLTGNIPSRLPNGLTDMRIDGNELSGDLPIFPNSLVFLYLGYPASTGNHFSGTLRLNAPIRIFINDNWITDIILQDRVPLDPSRCDLSNNPLLGNVYVAQLVECIQTGFYNASMLPNTLLKSTSKSSYLYASTTVSTSRSTYLSTAMFTRRNTYFSSSIAVITTRMTSMTSQTVTLTKATSVEMTSSTITTFVNLNSNFDLKSLEDTAFQTAVTMNVLTLFQPRLSPSGYSMSSIIKMLFDMALLVSVINKMPWKREWRNRAKRSQKALKSQADEF